MKARVLRGVLPTLNLSLQCKVVNRNDAHAQSSESLFGEAVVLGFYGHLVPTCWHVQPCCVRMPDTFHGHKGACRQVC